MRLKGVGINGAWILVREFFGWRVFENRRELGSLAGLTPTPHKSGDLLGESTGVSKAGNKPDSMGDRNRARLVHAAFSTRGAR